MSKRLENRGVTLVVTGSVAAYKAAIVARLLSMQGAEVQAILTRSAERFLGAATLGGLTGNAPLTDMFANDLGGEIHVDLAQDSDVIVVAPATADFIARVAQGRADDLATATLLCASCPVVLAPAMHPSMWGHPATQRNVAAVVADGRVTFAGPVTGEVASGDVGLGRLAEPEAIVDAIVAAVGERDLEGTRLIVTAGPTVEDLDPVRFVSNRSSGKMGFALAARAAERGADVTLVTGPVALATPAGVRRVDVRSALELQAALWSALGKKLGGADAVLMAAAVGDYRPAKPKKKKIKKKDGAFALELVQNPDVLAELGSARNGRRPVLVGFAVETASDAAIVDLARDKLEKKRVDLVVANHAQDSFGRDANRVTLVTAGDAERLPDASKAAVADRILDRTKRLLDVTGR